LNRLWSALLWLSLVVTMPLVAGGPVAARVGNAELQVTLARDDAARRQGLMGRISMGQNEGMLLVYPTEQIIYLWMLNTHLPLDAGFFDRNMVLTGVVTMYPDGGRKIHASPGPAIYALEMNQGWFARHGIQAGARLFLPGPVRGE
jgi:uncharacterized protein